MPSLLEFSTEVLDLILEFCDMRSIQCCRLANGLLRGVADRHLLRGLPLYYNQESLDRIDSLLTTHRHMTTGIRALWLQADRLEELPTFQAWDAHRQKQSKEEFATLSKDWAFSLTRDWATKFENYSFDKDTPLPALEVDPLGHWTDQFTVKYYLMRSYRRYVELYAEQLQLDRSDALREKSAALFRVCPYLTTVWITSGDYIRPTSTHRSATFRKGKPPKPYRASQD